MITKELTCIECPLGCHIEVDLEYDNKVAAVRGNSCPRGKAYAESEVVCPVRVLTSSVRATDGTMVCVKTDKNRRFFFSAGFAARRPAAAGQFRPVSRGGTSCFL